MERSHFQLYIKAEPVIEVTEPVVTLGDIVQMECRNQSILNRLNSTIILKFKRNQYKRTVISILKIIEQIHGNYPDMQIMNLGVTDIIVVYENQKTPSKTFHLCKAGLVSVVAFIGAAYSIMAFSNDVDTLEIFDLIYELIVGRTSTGFTVLEASYSIGLIIGVLLFFQHFGKKKQLTDPTPMEIEMRLYEQDIQTTLVQNYSRRGEEIDVGDSNIVDYHRNQ